MTDNEALKLINKSFSVNLDESSYEKKITEVLQWDSFLITSLLSEITSVYGVKIDLESLFTIKTIKELVNIIIATVEGR